MRNRYEVLPLNFTSYLIHYRSTSSSRRDFFEQGRALIWSEMRGLRTSVDQLHDGLGGMDRIGPLLVKQRKLLDDRDNLLSQVRSLSGFESFLKTPSFKTLTSAASQGPVIIINHSQWRSDIIILLHNSSHCLINTADDFYDRAIKLRDRLTTSRIEHGLDSKRYERDLRSVLGGLYDLVGRSVIEMLRYRNVPEQSRVWWCPTSVFCSLPLHAMGPIPSGDGIKRHFFDLYIPSYTPTLSALIESRKPGEQTFKKPSILLVAQPDQSLLSAFSETSVIKRLDTEVTTLISNKASPSAVLKRLRDHRFSHFACHGNLEDGKPFDASFQLHDGKRLTLLDIIRSRLPTAEFAFLSACHTAEMTKGSIADEALHLTAAMQYCGFRSVVGTMWGMADVDGPGLVKDFYESIFSSKQIGTPYYERSAKALRDAVRRLRKTKGLPVERWVNFVHYGA
ncbi:CHAT domain-containing protein [Russula earlei]|uniref:CHAT domain-containing protein n=1 Tax=Russula earlei TaxID=71964 RepID=A0ACC0TTN7_9AGAM|nr:CHAT domain-containing protein [Russula earlei]